VQRSDNHIVKVSDLVLQQGQEYFYNDNSELFEAKSGIF
jgi:hypothetical protein